MGKKEHFNLMYFIYPCTCLREIIFLQKFSQEQPSKTVLNYFHFQGNFWEIFILAIAAPVFFRSKTGISDPRLPRLGIWN